MRILRSVCGCGGDDTAVLEAGVWEALWSMMGGAAPTTDLLPLPAIDSQLATRRFCVLMIRCSGRGLRLLTMHRDEARRRQCWWVREARGIGVIRLTRC